MATRATFLIAALPAFAFLAAPIRASAEDCIDYADHIHWLSSHATGNLAHDVALSGYLACVAETRELGQWAAFQVVDVSDPEHPAALGELLFSGATSARGIATMGTIAVVAIHSPLPIASSRIVDFSDPSAPFVVRTLNGASDVCIAGDRTYLVGNRLEILDLAAPSTPTSLGTVPVRGEAVAAAGDHAYIAQETFGLQIVDVSSPAAAAVVGSLSIPSGAYDVAVTGNLVLVAAGGGGLLAVDVSVPSAPVIAGNLTGIGWTSGVTVTGNTAFVAGSALRTVDVSDPSQPIVVGMVSIGDGRRVTLAGGQAYVAAELGGLAIVDVPSPTSPEPLGSLATAPPRRIAARSELALLLNATELELIDVSGITPTLVGQVPLPDGLDVVSHGEFALVAAGAAGLEVVDVQDPPNASVIATLDTPGLAGDLAMAGDLALVADASGLVLIDVSNPSAPVTLGIAPVDATQVAAGGGLAYAQDEATQALRVVDISDPNLPALRGALALGHVSDLAAAGHFVYALANALTVVDATNAMQPVIAATLPLPGIAHAITITGEVLYVTGSRFVQLVDISNPSDPHHLGGAYEFANAVDVAVGSDWMGIADQAFGLYVLPAQCGATAAVPAPAPSVSGLMVGPNPMRSQIDLRFTLAEPGRVRLDVFDVHGRRVRRLVADRLGNGAHRVTWDGRGDSGERTASGVYWLRLDWPGGTSAQPVTVLR